MFATTMSVVAITVLSSCIRINHEGRYEPIAVEMLGAYKASVAFLQEHRSALGGDHRTVTATINSEMLHLTKLFRTEQLAADDPASRSATTALMQYMRSDTSGTFTHDQRHKLIEIAASRLSSQADEVSSAGHGSQKSQTHLHSHRYLTSSEWDYIMDETGSFRTKQSYLSKIWLGWGLRYPSGPTFRSGLALLTVACKLPTHEPSAMHEALVSFQSEFRKLREIYPGEATVKVFPALASDFKTMYPSMLGDIVECRLDPSKIMELSHPRSIPVKQNNASLVRKDLSSVASTPSSSSSQSDLLRDLIHFAIGRAPAPPASSPPHRLRARSGKSPRGDAAADHRAGIGSMEPLAIEDRAELSAHASPTSPGTVHPHPLPPATEPAEHDNDLDIDHIAEQTAKFIANRKRAVSAASEESHEPQGNNSRRRLHGKQTMPKAAPAKAAPAKAASAKAALAKAASAKVAIPWKNIHSKIYAMTRKQHFRLTGNDKKAKEIASEECRKAKKKWEAGTLKI